MAFEVIPMPGEGTMYEEAPEVSVVSVVGKRPVVTIRYRANSIEEGKPQVYGEIQFLSVLEYRWDDFDHYYSPYENDEDLEFKLIRILDSQWVETMASKGWFQKYAGQRFGPQLSESRVKHFRIAFDDYGIFDVVALNIAIREFKE